MTGTITKKRLKDGSTSWGYSFFAGWVVRDGERVRDQRTKGGFERRRSAEAALRQAIEEQQHTPDKVSTSDSVTLKEFLEEWLPYHAKAKPLEPTTAARYTTLMAHATKTLGSVPLKDLTVFALDNLYAKLAETLSPKTIREVHNVVHVALKRAVKTKLIPFNPADGCDLPRVDQKEAVALSTAQLGAYHQAATGNWIDLFLRLDVAIGARRGELLACRWSDLDWTTSKLRIERSLYQVKGEIGIKPTKTRQARSVTVPPSLMDYLKIHQESQEQQRALFGPDYQRDLDLIFAAPDGNYRKPDSVSWAARYYAKKAGIKASLHTLRHTHASSLLAAGVPIANVSKRLGHRDSYTTAKIYQHALPDTDQDVAATWDKLMSGKTSAGPDVSPMLAQNQTNDRNKAN